MEGQKCDLSKVESPVQCHHGDIVEPNSSLEKAKFFNRLDESFRMLCLDISRDFLFHVEILELRRIFYMYLLWSPMVLPGEPIVLLYAPLLLIGRTNQSHEVVPSNCKGGSLAPQCGYLSLHV